MFIPVAFWKAPNALTVSPAGPLYLQPGEEIALEAAGESGTYNWSITGAATADGATITTPGDSADYSARLTPYVTDTITVTSFTSLNVAVTTYDALNLSPITVTVPVSTSQTFTVTNGLCVLSPPTACDNTLVNWSIISGSGSGSVDANGLFTASPVPGLVVLQAEDALGNTVLANITVTNDLQIAPLTLKIGLFSTQIFSAILGTKPYSYSVFSGTGSIGCQSNLTGTHTAAVTTINVTSTAGCSVVGVIKVGTEDICYRGLTGTTFTGATRGCGGTTAAAYTAGQTYNADQVVYTAPSLIGAATVRVTDVGLTTSDSSVQIIRPVDVKTGQYFACAKYDEGSLKCWGWNGNGQLGQGNTAAIGDSSYEVGGVNPFVNLGTGRTVSKFYLGAAHACAILDNNQTKCWGSGGNGRLGYGNTAGKGDNNNEMGDNLLPVDLGTGRFAVELALGGSHTCARLDNNSVKCWGNGASGRLGYEGTASRGDGANEMGDNLPTVNLGTGRTALKIVAGLDYTCALLDNNTVKCWGENQRGQLGKDSTADLGDGANEMGDNLTAINLGAGRTATNIISLYETVCVHRDNNTAICWGRNNFGQTGRGATGGANSAIGDAGGEMAAIAAINFSTGFGTLAKLFTLGRSVCAIDTSNVVKCWGYNAYGQLLLGNTTNATAPPATAMNFGTGLVPAFIDAYLDTICVLFTNDRIKCFGRARTGTAGQVNGTLLNGSVENSLGDNAAEVGNNLNYSNH